LAVAGSALCWTTRYVLAVVPLEEDPAVGARVLQRAEALGDLGVTKTHSRPSISDDNPLSEAQFKTLKYRPDFRAKSKATGVRRWTARELVSAEEQAPELRRCR
jgi:hypothetical protein